MISLPIQVLATAWKNQSWYSQKWLGFKILLTTFWRDGFDVSVLALYMKWWLLGILVKESSPFLSMKEFFQITPIISPSLH